jgi:hypothetical protein
MSVALSRLGRLFLLGLLSLSVVACSGGSYTTAYGSYYGGGGYYDNYYYDRGRSSRYYRGRYAYHNRPGHIGRPARAGRR